MICSIVIFCRSKLLISQFRKIKIWIFILYVLLSINLDAQIDRYSYNDIDLIELIEIEEDKFEYSLYSGLLHIKSEGHVSQLDDTLILNSIYQPSYSIKKQYNDTLNVGEVLIEIRGVKQCFNYATRISNKKKYFDLIFADDLSNNEINDTSSQGCICIVPKKIFRSKRTTKFMKYRTNFEVNLDIRSRSENHVIIIVEKLEKIDYHFFTNQKAVVLDNGFIFINLQGQRERVNYFINRNGKIAISNKMRFKEFHKLTP